MEFVWADDALEDSEFAKSWEGYMDSLESLPTLAQPEKVTMPEQPRSFKYFPSLDTPLSKDKVVKIIVFNISRYAKYQQAIQFKELVTLKTAIKAVEKYLSQPLLPEYLDRIKDDLFPSWESPHPKAIRGDCLGDCTFLEDVQSLGDGEWLIECGS